MILIIKEIMKVLITDVFMSVANLLKILIDINVARLKINNEILIKSIRL
jgi:hypothetical protein